MKPRARIVVADDHEAVRAGVRMILAREPDVEICAEAVNGEEAVAMVREFKPDLAILDVTMPVKTGLEAAKEIRRLAPSTKIIMFSMHDSAQMTEAARQVGAGAFVLKSSPGDRLLEAVHRLLSEKDGDGASHKAS